MMLFGSILWTLLAFLIVLSILVVIHELGHYSVGRYYGVRVAAFSVGFGPELYHRIDKNGTRWRIAAIPLGGYVKWADDENGASMPDRDALARMTPEQRAGSFHAKPVGQRAAIVAAGPIANFLLAFLLFTPVFWLYGDYRAPAKISEVVAGGMGERAGFKAGDRVKSIDGVAVFTFEDLVEKVSRSPDQTLTFVVERNGRLETLTATPRLENTDTIVKRIVKAGRLGLKGPVKEDIEKIEFSLPGAFAHSVNQSVNIVVKTLAYLWRVITFQVHGDQISGVVGIAVTSGEVAKFGVVAMIMLVAGMSVNLGFANLLPIPILDGGHLVFYAFEKLLGKPLSERTQEYAFRFGISVLLLLFMYAMFNDVTGYNWSKVLSGKPS